MLSVLHALAGLHSIAAIRVVKTRRDGNLMKNLLPEGTYEGGKCMDGTQAGYYYRAGSTNTWVMHVTGGGGCSETAQDCEDWLNKGAGTMGRKGSSAGWPDEREGEDLLDSDSDNNPVFHNAHHVYVPYCTADAHSGQVGTLAYSGPIGSEDPELAPWGNYYFDGHLNLQAIIAHLHETKPAFANMGSMLLQGHSAGGIGVFRNCDFIASEVRAKVGEHAQVKCNPISGWFVPGFAEGNTDTRAAPTHWDYWSIGEEQPQSTAEVDPQWPQNNYYPPSCIAALHPKEKPWLCGSVTYVYPTINQPMFISQDMFDYAQVHVGGLGMPKSNLANCKGQEFLSYFGKAMANTTTSMLKAGDGLFLTSCYSHSVTSTLQGKSNNQATSAWFTGDGTVPSVMTDTCHASTWLPCGEVPAECTDVTIPPCDECQEVLASLCTTSTRQECGTCVMKNVAELLENSCTEGKVMEFCAQFS